MDSGAEDITLDELINMALERFGIDLHVSMPGRVESYSAGSATEGPTVDVVPLLNRSLPDGAGNYVTEELPKLSDVPVAFHRGGGFIETLPLQKGDFVLLVFCDRNLGRWRTNGAQGDAGDLGRHTLDGAVAIPGVFHDKLPLQTRDADNMRIGRDGVDAAQIKITSTGGELGAGATKEVHRKGDHSDGGTLTLILASSGGAPVFGPGSQYVDPDGVVTVLTGTTATVPLKAKASEGSSKWKAID